MSEKIRAHFRLIVMPCCQHQFCWVNPRLPDYCPECGKFIIAHLRHHAPESIRVSDPGAWVEYKEQP